MDFPPSISGCALTEVEGRYALRGECDTSSSPHINEWLRRLAPCEVDLSGVTFFDSAALRIFIDARLRDSRFRIVNPSPAVHRVLDKTGTLTYLAAPGDELRVQAPQQSNG